MSKSRQPISIYMEQEPYSLVTLPALLHKESRDSNTAYMIS